MSLRLTWLLIASFGVLFVPGCSSSDEESTESSAGAASEAQDKVIVIDTSNPDSKGDLPPGKSTFKFTLQEREAIRLVFNGQTIRGDVRYTYGKKTDRAGALWFSNDGTDKRSFAVTLSNGNKDAKDVEWEAEFGAIGLNKKWCKGDSHCKDNDTTSANDRSCRPISVGADDVLEGSNVGTCDLKSNR